MTHKDALKDFGLDPNENFEYIGESIKQAPAEGAPSFETTRKALALVGINEEEQRLGVSARGGEEVEGNSEAKHVGFVWRRVN